MDTSGSPMSKPFRVVALVAVVIGSWACGSGSLPDGGSRRFDGGTMRDAETVDDAPNVFEDRLAVDDQPPVDDAAPVGDGCTPFCSGRVCGPDGCGGTCGTGCPAGMTCNDSAGQC